MATIGLSWLAHSGSNRPALEGTNKNRSQKKPARFFAGPEGGRLRIMIAALLSSGKCIMEDSHDNGKIRPVIL